MAAWILPSDKSFLQLVHLVSFLDVLLSIVCICSSSEGQITLGSGMFSGNASFFFPLLISECYVVHNRLFFIKFEQIVENPL